MENGEDVHKSIVPQVQATLPHDEAGLGFALRGGGCDRGHILVLVVLVNDDAVVRKLLLDQNNLLCPLHMSQQNTSAMDDLHDLCAYPAQLQLLPVDADNGRPDHSLFAATCDLLGGWDQRHMV